ncbi:phosphotransferase enzyme family protein [Streptomyces tailanensis]|uniref:phosphotransferase enzyme family protein n=1 Tax=Streptomyces tailanensis TaxID=2569858 RepID=UPI001FE5ED74|nr:phosphotransferase [Streptomyces tailanensis]
MNEADWDAAVLADILDDQYGLSVDEIEPLHHDTVPAHWRVLTDDGLRLLVTEYWSSTEAEVALTAWDMSEYCRAARLPVPRVWPDKEGDLVTLAEGSAWALADEAPGRVTALPMTVALAEHIGTVMGRMHRVLAAYPLPNRVQPTRWQTGTVQDAVAQCDRVLATTLWRRHHRPGQLRDDLDQRREDLHAHVHRLRQELPAALVEQALHAELTRTSLIVLADAVTGITNFRGATGLPAWELGRAAFDPRTVANSPQWDACALAMVSAYLAEDPSLPLADVRACARIALLDMLFSFHGAIPAEPGVRTEAEADLKQTWSEQQTTIRRLLNGLPALDEALAGLTTNRGRS